MQSGNYQKGQADPFTLRQQLATLIECLQSNDWSERFDACQQLQAAPELTPEARTALQHALNDSQWTVAEAARNTLMAHDEKLRVAASGKTVERVAADRKAKDRMTRGAAFFFGGLLITAVTYAIAHQSGGAYYLCYGAVVWGLIDMVAGFVAWRGLQ